MNQRPSLFSKWEKEIKAFFRHPIGVIGLAGVVFVFLVALFAPLLAAPVAGYGVYEERLMAPGLGHPFGTDDMGRDLFSQVVWGTRASIKVAVLAVLTASVIGVPIGLLSGYFHGFVDTIGMGLVEIFLTIPMLPLIIIVTAVSNTQSIDMVAIIIGLFSWPSIARITRASTLQVSSMQYIEAARCLGIRIGKIIFKHVLVNASTPVLINLTIVMATSIITESAISFLGLGDPTTFSWGKILHNAHASGAFASAWWFSLFPSVAIVWFVISFNFLSMGIRDALNPKITRG
jgi:peptide/nickel transport system permease protein